MESRREAKRRNRAAALLSREEGTMTNHHEYQGPNFSLGFMA